MPKCTRQEEGLSLLEILVCIAIVGIFATLVAPSYVNLLEQREIIAAAEAITADLRWARSEALKRNSDILVTFEPGSAGHWRYILSMPDAVALKTVAGAATPEFSQVSLTENLRHHRTTFNSTRGTAEGQNGTITLVSSHANYIVEVVLSNLGRVHICAKTEQIGDYQKCA